MDLGTTIVSVSPVEPAVWIASPLAALAFGLAVFFGCRVIWSGATTRIDCVLRSLGSVALFLALLLPFISLHGFLMSLVFRLLHGPPWIMVCTLFAPWSRIIFLLGGLLGLLISIVQNLRHRTRPIAPA